MHVTDFVNPWLFLWSGVALIIYMTLTFLLAQKRQRLDTVDAAWGGGFVVVASLVAGLFFQPLTVLVLALVVIWATRITDHLATRVLKNKADDPRYAALAQKWNPKWYWVRAYVSIFLLQGALVLVISLPVVFAANHPLDSWKVWAVIGAALWIAGFITETIADRQLKSFLASADKHKPSVLETGLWRYSRHPNYLGEITQWFGIGIIACGAQHGWIGLLGPTSLMLLIRFVSGVPPIETRKKHEPAYEAYMQRTNAIWPKFSRLK